MRPRRIAASAAVLAFAGILQAQAAPREGAAIVAQQCAKCHATGLEGAPRIGDRKAWIERARFGLDTLLANVIKGHGRMPSRGGMSDLTDAETRAAIDYMVRESLRPEAPPATKKP